MQTFFLSNPLSCCINLIFQTTFNEHGMCYTFNNYPHKYSNLLKHKSTTKKYRLRCNSDDFISHMPLENTIRNAKGCGKNSGFQLIIDSHKMTNLIQKHKGYKIHITLPGVVSSEVPYIIDPGYEGEHNFIIHGIHKITVSHYSHTKTAFFLISWY